MTTFYFIGGEDTDLRTLGSGTYVTSGIRSAYARVGAYALAGTDGANGFEADFSVGTPSFWFTAQMQGAQNGGGTVPFLLFYDGGIKRIAFSATIPSGALSVSVFDDGGAATILAATANYNLTYSNLQKIDVHIDLATGIKLFQRGNLLIRYDGPVSMGTSTSINRARLGSTSSTSTTTWSEVIVADEDTRTMCLRTHAPTGAGTYNQWTGSWSDIDENIATNVDLITTSTAENVSSFALADSPTGTFGVKAVKVSALAARDATGPQSIDLGIRTGGSDAFAVSQTPDTGWTRLNNVWQTNPVTGQPWTVADTNGMEMIFKAKA